MPSFPAAQPPKAIDQLVSSLRKRFPEKVDATILRQLGIAPNNETYIINALKFIGVLSKENMRTDKAHALFVKSGDEFLEGFSELVEEAYKPLFDLRGEESWTLDREKLITFFRNADKSTEVVGKRQADTFIKLAEIGGKRELTSGNIEVRVPPKSPPRQENKVQPKKKDKASVTSSSTSLNENTGSQMNDISLAVRIEVVLPQSTDQATYDAIFRSIRENLISRD